MKREFFVEDQKQKDTKDNLKDNLTCKLYQNAAHICLQYVSTLIEIMTTLSGRSTTI